jgi:F-type H+-transporting ATPase subunit c
MIETFYTTTIAIPVACTAIGAGIGQGLIGVKALQAINIQPQASAEINKMSLIGMSITETSGILGLVISILLILNTSIPLNYEFASLGRIGIGLAIGLTGLVAGIASSLPAQAACLSVARQPFFSNKILQLMLITQTVIMTPNIFGFIIALLINLKTPTVNDLNNGLQLLAAGLAIGLGSIGPSIGLSFFAQSACTAIGVNRKSYNKIMTFTFICEGMIETPVIFSFLISLLILSINTASGHSELQGIAFIASALCIGLSTFGTGISTGKVGATACKYIGKTPENYSTISKIGFLALPMIDTFVIYGFIIAIILIYAV